jgi:hypothetical protein
MWAVRKGGEIERYTYKKEVLFRGQTRHEYRSAKTDRPWNGSGVEAILIRPEEGEIRFNLSVPEEKRQQGAYRQFVSSDGWVITETETGPSDNPEKSQFGRLLLFFFVHAFHLVLWFVCLWLLLRFQWSHALMTALVLWIIASLIIVPMLVGYAADVSRARQVPAPVASAALEEPVVCSRNSWSATGTANVAHWPG